MMTPNPDSRQPLSRDPQPSETNNNNNHHLSTSPAVDATDNTTVEFKQVEIKVKLTIKSNFKNVQRENND